MKIKLSRATVLGPDKTAKAGEVVEVSDKQGRELVLLKRGTEAPATPAKKAAKKAPGSSNS